MMSLLFFIIQKKELSLLLHINKEHRQLPKLYWHLTFMLNTFSLVFIRTHVISIGEAAEAHFVHE